MTFGGGVKACAGTSKAIFASARQPREHAEPAVGLAAGRRDDPLGDLALEHQRHGEVEGRPRLDGQPADQQLGADIVGQVGDDPGRRPAAIAAKSVFSASPAMISSRPG